MLRFAASSYRSPRRGWMPRVRERKETDVKNNRKKLPVGELVIRVLIILVVCVSILLSVGLFMELRNTRMEIDDLKAQIERYEESAAK